MAVYFFYGEEDYNIEQEIDTLKQGLDKNFLDMSYKVYDHPKFVDLISILRSQPLMFGKMLVVIKSVNYFFFSMISANISNYSAHIILLN